MQLIEREMPQLSYPAYPAVHAFDLGGGSGAEFCAVSISILWDNLGHGTTMNTCMRPM